MGIPPELSSHAFNKPQLGEKTLRPQQVLTRVHQTEIRKSEPQDMHSAMRMAHDKCCG